MHCAQDHYLRALTLGDRLATPEPPVEEDLPDLLELSTFPQKPDRKHTRRCMMTDMIIKHGNLNNGLQEPKRCLHSVRGEKLRTKERGGAVTQG